MHFIVNNQIGFTTYPRYSRSSPYPSDVAKMIEAPIFHVNGDDPEAVVFAAKVATEFRQKFQKPVVIDMFCYRRFGHNEGDEPSFTQPLMYKKIRSHPTTLEIYGKKLIGEGVVTEGEVEKMKADWRARLDAEFEAGQGYKPNKADWLDGRWAGLKAAREVDDPRRGNTGVAIDDAAGDRQEDHRGPARLPRPPHHPALPRQPRQGDRDRRGHRLGDRARRWPSARCCSEGHPVRLSGQDCERGTFSQRHSVLIDQETEERHTPFNHLGDGPGALRGDQLDALGRGRARLRIRLFAAEPNALTLWEAQFGDFANGAQVRVRPVHLLGRAQMAAHVRPRLPAAARLRRPGAGAFLGAARALPADVRRRQHAGRQLHDAGELLPHPAPAVEARDPQAADPDDAEVRCCATSARSRGSTRWRPAPRSTACCGTTRKLLPDEKIKLVADDKIRRVVLCSGKVYYDLYEEREKRGIDDIYLLRVEQLYPFPTKALVAELSRFKQAEMVWCQEEPRNMGAWFFVDVFLEWVLNQIGAKHRTLRYAGRPASASTAVGQMSKHLAQLKQFLDEALG